MKFNTWSHTGVKKDGTFYKERGAVNTVAGINESTDEGNCGLEGCNCSNGHWICFSQGWKKGKVEGFTIYFDTLEDKKAFKKTLVMDEVIEQLRKSSKRLMKSFQKA